MRRIAILKTGSTRLTQTVARRGGDYESWFAETLVPLGVQVEVLDAVGSELPDRNNWDGVVITGSPASVHHREPWSEAAGRWIAQRVAKGMPTLVQSVKDGLNGMPPTGLCADCTDEEYQALIVFMASPASQ